jgi:uncharacterized protein YqfB (UPF0267 family)
MEYIFNELSANNPAKNKVQAIEWMQTLLKTCKVANKLGFIQLRVIDDFYQTVISKDYTILDWLSHDADFDSKAFLLSLLQSPCIGREIQEEKFIYMEKTILADNSEGKIEQEAEGLGVAYLTNKKGTLSISFASDSKWDKTEISLVYCFEKNTKLCKEHIKVKHASKPEHITEHKVWILKKKSLSKPYINPSLYNILPNKKISNQLVDNNWGKFREKLKQYPDDKNAMIKEMAKNVADINGYKYNKRISSINSTKKKLRDIYETVDKHNNKIYLSTDFETGAFELCNHKGEHQGEYGFNGTKNKEAQPKNHSIRLS